MEGREREILELIVCLVDAGDVSLGPLKIQIIGFKSGSNIQSVGWIQASACPCPSHLRYSPEIGLFTESTLRQPPQKEKGSQKVIPCVEAWDPLQLSILIECQI